MTNRFLGRDPATVAADLSAIRAELADIEDAKTIWRELDSLARNQLASAYTRRRAHKAATALGSLIDDTFAADAAEQPFSWNDPTADDE